MIPIKIVIPCIRGKPASRADARGRDAPPGGGSG